MVRVPYVGGLLISACRAKGDFLGNSHSNFLVSAFQQSLCAGARAHVCLSLCMCVCLHVTKSRDCFTFPLVL